LLQKKEAISVASKVWGIALGLLVLAGCTFPVRQKVDDLICDRSNLARDLQPGKEGKTGESREGPDGTSSGKVQQAGLFLTATQETKPLTTLEKRLTVPKTVPGSEAPFIIWPDSKAPKEVREAAVKKFFPPVLKVEPDPDFPPGPGGNPLTLTDLQKIAFANSPLLKQAASDIEAARGAAIQAGAYPNPTFGYETSSAGPSGGPNVGMFMSQTIKTWGKLKLAQAAAMMDLRAAEFAYRRAETDLMTNVRGNYYAVLWAQESIRANRGLVELTDEVYRVMVDQVKGGEGAPYEPLQLSVFSGQARAALVTARNSRLLAWRQLAASLGVPHMPATALAGQINRPVPRIDFDKALAHVLTKHTDVLTTASTIEKARHNLRLAQVTPYPDVTVQAGVLNDLGSSGPSRLVSSVQVSVPVPLFDQNKGGIRQSQAALVRAVEEPHRVDADLTARFSDAYRRYEENRILLEMYQTDILPKQVQAFRTAVKRHFGGAVGAVAFNDLVSSEQNLVTVIGNYLPILQAQWQAVVDISSLLQTDQLYQAADEVNSAPAVDFEELLKLPCHHRCAPVVPAPTRDSFRMPPTAGPLSQAAPAASVDTVTSVRATFATPLEASTVADAAPAYPRVDANPTRRRDIERGVSSPDSAPRDQK
jgi:cobalt-zinc-cadmium efflux system outer membrane protein